MKRVDGCRVDWKRLWKVCSVDISVLWAPSPCSTVLQSYVDCCTYLCMYLDMVMLESRGKSCKEVVVVKEYQSCPSSRLTLYCIGLFLVGYRTILGPNYHVPVSNSSSVADGPSSLIFVWN